MEQPVDVVTHLFKTVHNAVASQVTFQIQSIKHVSSAILLTAFIAVHQIIVLSVLEILLTQIMYAVAQQI